MKLTSSGGLLHGGYTYGALVTYPCRSQAKALRAVVVAICRSSRWKELQGLYGESKIASLVKLWGGRRRGKARSDRLSMFESHLGPPTSSLPSPSPSALAKEVERTRGDLPHPATGIWHHLEKTARQVVNRFLGNHV